MSYNRFMDDKEYLKRAVEQAAQSAEQIGCGVIIVQNGELLAEAYNSQKADNIAIHHAEIKAIIEANKKTGSRTLPSATAYCSCEPCAMCLTALSYAKVERIVYNKTMKELSPADPQSDLDPYMFIQGLNFKPSLKQLNI